MQIASSIFSFKWLIKHFIKGIALVLILFSIATPIKLYLSYKLAPYTHGLNALLQEKELDLLFIGSSHTRQSYDISIIEKKCNCKAFALSYSGLDPHLMNIILEYIKENSDLKVKKIVIEAYAFKMIAPPSFSDSRIFSHAPIELKFKLLRAIHKNVKEFDFRRLYQLLIAENNESLLTFFPTNKILSKYSYKGGYQNKTTTILSEADYIKSYENVDLYLSKLKNNKIQIQAVKEIMSRYGQDEIIFIDPPMPYPVITNKTTVAAMDTFKNLTENSGYKYLVPWLTNNESKTPDNFSDWNHLSNKGRKIYSEEIYGKL